MKVFKFGGASVKDAQAVRNVARILSEFDQSELMVVVSAMGKTTNAMENIVLAMYDGQWSVFQKLIKERRDYHRTILKELFYDETHPIFETVDGIFDELSAKQRSALPPNYDFQYDQIVSLGELLSTKIITAFLQQTRTDIIWGDARKFIRTNNKYRAAEVDRQATSLLLDQFLAENTNKKIVITQGFIAHTDENFTTTLGREGSDFTAGIIAYCTNATDVTIWKDVPGMLNADPKWFDKTEKLDLISFKEAIELAYYGASVIHPKTIKPLQNKNIPLYVKSFLSPSASGTVIHESTAHDHLIPSFIFKVNQVLLSITPKDFSFIVEKNLSDIFGKLALSGGHINLMQNSAVSFTVCLDIDDMKLNKLMSLLDEEYLVQYNRGLELVTIRHYDQATIDRVSKHKEILMEQKTRHTARIVMQNGLTRS